MRNICTQLALACLLLLTFISNSPAFGADVNTTTFGYDDYADVLSKYVNDKGMVNYAGLKSKPEKLTAFAERIGVVDPNDYEKWSRSEQIAFWLNAYNGLTMKVIIDNYPIKSSIFRSFVYPANSIRQIAGAWDKIIFDVMGRKLTLGHIEHEILRKNFDEPRIHMALVCAAMGCPPLRNEPYLGKMLDDQLDDQSRRFLSNPEKFRIDEMAGIIHLSPIFKWFAKDFSNKYAPKDNIGKHPRNTSAVLNFVAGRLPESQADFVLRANFKIEYLDYDWSLNEQKAAKGEKRAK